MRKPRLRIKLPSARSVARALKELFVRFYTLCILGVVVWAGYLAFVWLIKFVFVPTPVPARLLEWQAHVDASSLRADNVPGVTGSASRAPLGHYHKVERWFQSDKLNGCTVVGCHEPLPHTQKNKIPAFANFHTTFLACEMCHQASPDHSQRVVWITTTSYGQQNPPAALRMIQFIQANAAQIKGSPASVHAPIVALLRELLKETGSEPILSDVLLRLETTDPGSPVWRRAMDRLEHELPNHARGEYGAKLARENGVSFRDHAGKLTALASEYLNTTDLAAKKKINDQIHAGVTREAAACTSCHGETNSAIRYESLGYTAERSRTLYKLELANLMQQIRQGKEFHIPKLLGGGQ